MTPVGGIAGPARRAASCRSNCDTLQCAWLSSKTLVPVRYLCYTFTRWHGGTSRMGLAIGLALCPGG